MDGFNFPFVRDQPYSLGELRRFHNDVISARRQHPALSRRIRGHNVPWAKLFLEELSPAMLFADNNQIPDFHEFRAMPEGNPADIQLISPGAVVRLQVTTAYPEWDASANAQRGWSGGYIKSLERDGINRGAAVFGGGRTIRTVGGDIESEPRSRSPEVDRLAWQEGITQAIGRKLAKAHLYTGLIDVLVVYASQLRFNTIDEPTCGVVIPAIYAAIHEFDRNPFSKIVVLDYDPLCYVEYKN
jgi:hypothetical protein